MLAQPEDDESLRDLLQHMLTPIRRARETPLQFEIDSSGIARSASTEFLAGIPGRTFEKRDDWEPVTTALDTLIARTLADGPDLSSTTSALLPRSEKRGPSAAGRRLHPLAAWLERFFNVMRTVDHRAFEILGRRIEGLQDRDIATELDLGLRLVKRIQQDMRASWAREFAKE